MRYATVHRLWLLEQDVTSEDLGIWTRLAVFAADLELGEGEGELATARIAGCRGWSANRWMRTAGLTPAEAIRLQGGQLPAELAHWEGDDLLIEGYDLGSERAYQARVSGGKKGGRPPKKPKAKTSAENHRFRESETNGLEPPGNPLTSLNSTLLNPQQQRARARDDGAAAAGDGVPDVRTIEAYFVAEHARRFELARAAYPPPKDQPRVRAVAQWCERSGMIRATVDQLLERFFACSVAHSRDYRAAHLEHWCAQYASGAPIELTKRASGMAPPGQEGDFTSDRPGWLDADDAEATG